MLYGRILNLLGAVLLLAIAGCNSNPATTAQASAAEAVAEGASWDDYVYRLGPGDEIRLIVYQEPDLSGTFTINATGEVALPLVGAIEAQNLTIEEFSARVSEALSNGYLQDAQVAAEIVTYRPYYIYGEVTKPGEYPFGPGMNVVKAVAAAGGYTYRAKKTVVYIRRSGTDFEEKMTASAMTMIYPGDVVRVGERFF